MQSRTLSLPFYSILFHCFATGFASWDCQLQIWVGNTILTDASLTLPFETSITLQGAIGSKFLRMTFYFTQSRSFVYSITWFVLVKTCSCHPEKKLKGKAEDVAAASVEGVKGIKMSQTSPQSSERGSGQTIFLHS